MAVICDNGGFAVIHRLQTGQGAEGFNNLFADCAAARAPRPGCRWTSPRTPAHWAATVQDVPAGATVDQLRQAYRQARADARETGRPAVVVCRTHPSSWTESGAWWEVGVPSSLSGRAGYDAGKAGQLRWSAQP